MTNNKTFLKWFRDYFEVGFHERTSAGFNKHMVKAAYEAGQQSLNLEDILNGEVKAYCKGCGSTESLNEIKSKGFLSCCPDRFLILGEEKNDKEYR